MRPDLRFLLLKNRSRRGTAFDPETSGQIRTGYLRFGRIRKFAERNRRISLRERFNRFMQGRYGFDDFSGFLLGVSVVLLLLNMFFRIPLLNTAALAVLAWLYFRVLSRNYARRAAENRKYLEHTAGIRRFLAEKKRRLLQLRTHHIYRCPGCGQKIRIPRGRGRIVITCPKCRQEFTKKS